MKPVFLIGYMCSGKTTLGTAVGRLAGLEFIDLDQYIEEQNGMTVAEIFKSKGENGFRDLERQALHALSSREDLLIACGGGTPCFFDNIEVMNEAGTTVWLDASEKALLRRLLEGREKRPLIASKSDDEIAVFIGESLGKRRSFYERASHRFDSDRLESIEEVDESARDFISRFLI